MNEEKENNYEKQDNCKICGGRLIYIECLNKIICDTCEYEENEAM